MRAAVCLFVRNEERDIAEWVVYHSLIGFDAFIIYDNGSDDSTPQVLDRLRRLYNVKIIDWPRATKYAQLEAYDDCLKNFRDDFDWIAFVDSDEFVAPVRDGSVKPMLARLEGIDGVFLNWSIFGSSGHDAAPAGLIVENFTRRAVDDRDINANVKMIVRAKAAVHVLDPHSIAVEGRTAHANGDPCHRKENGGSETFAGFSTCRVNHYFTRSREHWRAKMRRGYREGHRPDDVFATHDLNDVEDLWAARHAKAIKSALAMTNSMPLRPRTTFGPVASTEAEKNSPAWLAQRPAVGDVLYKMPDCVLEPGNELFDRDFYLSLYDDVRRSGLDPFDHFRAFGYAEGRRPCARATLLAYLKRIADQ